MKRYLAFTGDAYYPSGGMNDFLDDFDSKESAILAIEKNVKDEMYHETIALQWKYTWAHIYDTEEGEIIWEK